MSVNLGTAYVDVEPDFDNFHRKVAAEIPALQRRFQGLSTSQSRSTQTTSRLSRATAGLGGTLARAAGAAAGAAAAYLSISQAKAAIDTTEGLAKASQGLSRNLGLSVKEASRWGAVAIARDIDTKSLTMSFTTLSRQLVDASRGSDTAQQSFADIGVTQRELRQTNGDFTKQLLLVADGFGKAEGGAIRQQAAQKLLGRGYQALLPLFAEGSKSLEEQLHWADEYGVTLNKRTIGPINDLISAQRESKEAWLGIQVTFTQMVAPALEVAHEKFQSLARIMGNDKLTDAEKFRKAGDKIARWAGEARDAFIGILPKLVEKAGETGPKIAVALAKGFIHSGALGKIFLTGTFIRMIGGPGALGRVGAAMGGRIAAGAAGSAAASKWSRMGTLAGRMVGPAMGLSIIAMLATDPAVQKAIKDMIAGEPLDAPNRETFAVKANEMFGGMEGYESFLGREKVKIETMLGSLIFNARTEKLVKAQNNKLGKLVGEDMGAVFQKYAKMTDGVSGEIVRSLNRGDNAVKKHSRTTKDSLGDAGGAWSGYGRDVGDASKRGNRDAKGHGGTVDNVFNGIWGDLDRGSKKLRGYADGADKSFGETSGSAKQMAKRTSSSVRDLANVVKGGMENIGENTNEALKAFNVKKLAFSFKTVGGAASDLVGAQKGAIVPGAGSGDTVPLHIGGQLAAMVEPGEQVSVLNRKATAAMMRINDRIPRFRDGGLVPHLAKGGMAAMLSLANAFDRADEPYVWGGGHGGFLTQPTGTDCSGAVSAILHAGGLLQGAPMTSGSLMSWGKSATGREPLVVYANPHHTVMSLNGKTFGTSGSNPNGGAGWIGAPGASLAPGAMRTMGVTGAAVELARVLLDGPDGPLKKLGQAALDRVWKAGKGYIADHMPRGSFGGGDSQLPGKSGKYTATWYGPTLDQLGSPVYGTGGRLTGEMAFAELGNGTQVSGALGDLPWNTRIGVTYKGKTIQVDKRDVGTGQVANPPNAIDLWETAAAQLPGFMAAGVDVVNVSGLQGGGIAGRDPAFGTFPGFKRDRYISQKEWDRLVHIAGMGRYGSHFRQFRKGVWAAKQWQEGALPRVGKMYRHARHQAHNPWGDHDVWTRGEGVPHLAGGGKPGKKGDGHVHVGPGRLDPAWKRFAHAQKIATRLKELIGERGKIARLDETIGRAETLAGLESSQLGSDLSPSEIARQIALNERLLETMVRARKLAHSGLRDLHFPRGMSTTGVPAAQLKNLRGSLGSTLVDLTGLTGKGGRIFDTKMQLDTLRHTSSGSAAALDISGLRGVIEAARFGVFDGAFATGGKIKPGHWGVAGEQGPEIVRGPATVHPSGDALLAPRVEVHNSFDWDGFDLVVTTTVDGQLAKRERISHHRERQLVR